MIFLPIENVGRRITRAHVNNQSTLCCYVNTTLKNKTFFFEEFQDFQRTVFLSF